VFVGWPLKQVAMALAESWRDVRIAELARPRKPVMAPEYRRPDVKPPNRGSQSRGSFGPDHDPR
jgi:hypothetical protein